MGSQIDAPWDKSVASDFLACLIEAIRFLSNKGTPMPRLNDVRHCRANWTCGNLRDLVAQMVARDWQREGWEDIGVFHFMVWVPRGQQKREAENVGVVL